MAYGRRVMRKSYKPKKKRTVRKRKPTRRARKAIRRTAKKPSLPSCTRLYAKALLDPSDPSVVGVCYPSGMTLPSQKFHEKMKGSFVISPAGYGFILMQDVLMKSEPAIVTTSSTSTFGANEDTVFGAATGLKSKFLTKCPYEQADFDQGLIDARMVVCGYKYRYAGRQDALSGVCYDLEDPDHSNQYVETINSFKSHRMADQHPVDNNWHYVKWSGPVRVQEETYYQTGFAGESGQYFCGTVIYAEQGSTIVWEADYHIEYHGNKANGATFNDIDVGGTAKVINAAKKDAQTHSSGYLASMLGYVGDFAKDVALNVVPRGGIRGWLVREAARSIPWKHYGWMAATTAASLVF